MSGSTRRLNARVCPSGDKAGDVSPIDEAGGNVVSDTIVGARDGIESFGSATIERSWLGGADYGVIAHPGKLSITSATLARNDFRNGFTTSRVWRAARWFFSGVQKSATPAGSGVHQP